MASEQGLAAKEPLVNDLKNEDLAHATQIAKKTDTVDATDVLQLEIRYGSSVSSSEEEVPKESSEDPIKEVLVQTSVTEEERIAVYNESINNKEGSNPEEAGDGAKALLLVGTEPVGRSTNGKPHKLIRAPRYFDPPKCNWPACNEHGKNDDGGKKDNPKRKRKPCYICSDISHQGKRCKKVNVCFICAKKGHLVMDCPNKNVKPDCTTTPCLKCGNTGHDMISCTNNYDSEDLKLIQCYICKQVGHLCCVDKKSEGPREASCYNCGQSGHFGIECTKLNEVTNDHQPLCRKCGERGHSRRKCTKRKKAKKEEAATKAEKKKSRKARRARQTPIGNASMHQPNVVWWPQVVGPYYGRPGSNVWLSPAAAAAKSNLCHKAEALPSHQHIYHHQVGPQAINSFDHRAGLPHQYWSPQTGTQITRLPIKQETGIMLPSTENQMPVNSYYPVIQLQHPTRVYQKGILQPNLNRRVLLPQIESRAPQNSPVIVDPTSSSNLAKSSTTS